MSSIKPYKSSESKKIQITRMFNNIAKNYDFLNHCLSFGMDYLWRKTAVKKLNNPSIVLDIATGTADFAISTAKYTNAKITGIDISQGMLDIGIKKINKKNLTDRIILQNADSENLPFKVNTFDAITAGFGVRNFENLKRGLSEIYRVLKSNGVLVILEPSSPNKFPLKQIYKLYFSYLLPVIGRLISKDKNAYKYLPDSVSAFASGEKFINKLKEIGFKECQCIPLTFGIVNLYVAIK